ncbi:MAG: PP0621 family protein [Pseudomonadota bacterium]
MIRSILLVLLVWSLLWLGQRWYQKFKQNQENKNNKIRPPAKAQHNVMVRCDYCGLYFPEQEAHHAGNARYCCEAHERAAQLPPA